MDKTLAYKKEQLKKALDAFQEALEQNFLKNALMRDAAIQRFEYTFELGWKTAKVFLRKKYGLNIFSPKETFREMHRSRLITEAEAELLLQMVDDRNLTTHSYDEDFMKKLAKRLPDYYEVMMRVHKFAIQ